MQQARNPSHALGLVVVDELARCGVGDAILAPGSRSTALALALEQDPRIRLHVALDERSAAFLAVGMARMGRRPVPVVTTSGTATANLHPAVLEADAARVPLLAVTADRPPELRDSGANQTVDQVGLYGGAVRFSCDVGVAEDRPGVVAYWRSTISRAVAATRGLGGAPGPAHVNLGFREPTVPATDDGRTAAPGPFSRPLDGRPGGRAWTVVQRGPRVPDPDGVAALAERIAGTERGVVVLGDIDAPPAALRALVRATGWPAIAEPVSGARAGGSVVAAAHHLLANDDFAGAHRPELALRLGRQALSRPVTMWLGTSVPQVLVDPDGAWLDPTRGLRRLLVADPAATCEALVDHLPEPGATSAWRRDWAAADDAATDAVAAVLADHPEPTEPAVARDVAAAVPDGGVLVAASSMPVRDLDRHMAPRAGLQVVGNRGASGIDGFVSTAIGVAMAADGAPTVALAGDLSLLHDSNGFLLFPEGDPVDLVVVVVNNDGGGIFHLLPQADHAGFERLFGTPHGRDPAALAALHGLAHERVDRADEVAPAVRAGLAAGGIRIVEVRTDRDETATLRAEIQAAVDDALA